MIRNPATPLLRAYQDASADAVEQALAVRRNPLIVIPTGGGKSYVIAETIKRLVSRPTRPTILVLSHVKELIKQNSQKLRLYAPEIAQGIYSAGLKQKRSGAQVVLGTVQTVVRSLNALGARSYLIIDEAHLCPREQDSQYGAVFEHFSLAPRIGYTATNMRLDSGSLTEGPDAWFDEVAYEIAVGQLIKERWLLPLSGVLTEQQALLDGVRSRAGDFIAERAEEEVMKLSLDEVVGEMVMLAQLRNHILVFAAGVKHAHAVHEKLVAMGIDAGLVLGDTDSDDRAESIDRFKAGKLRVLVSVGVLTTGFDAPLVDCIACLRPTKSQVLWTQMLGRGMRVWKKKENCLLLDFVGNLDRLGGAGCVLDVEDRRKPQEERERGKALFPKERKTEFESATHADPMGIAQAGVPFEAKVLRVRYFLIPSKQQPGKQIVCCDYALETEAQGLRCAARMFLCVEYEGYARQLAERWFRRRGMIPSQIPTDAPTALALAKVLPDPARARAYWDPKQRSYLIVNEAFAAPV